MGFKPETGLAVYNLFFKRKRFTPSLACRGKLKRGRLFRYIPSDYYRKVTTMSTPKLTMKIVGYGLKAKVIFDLMSID